MLWCVLILNSLWYNYTYHQEYGWYILDTMYTYVWVNQIHWNLHTQRPDEKCQFDMLDSLTIRPRNSYFTKLKLRANPCAARTVYIQFNPCVARTVYIRFNPCPAMPVYIRFNPCPARPVYIRLNPCAARTVYIQLNPCTARNVYIN